MHDAEFVIVGGGIYGVTVALDLATRGRRVTVLEAGELASGASGGPGERGLNGHRAPCEFAFAKLAQARWQEFQDAIDGGVGYRRVGSFQVFDVPYGARLSEILAQAQVRAQVQCAAGLPASVLTGDQVRELEPEVGQSVAGALYFPTDGVCDHTFATQQIAREAIRRGALVRTGAVVAELICHDSTATGVKLTNGEVVLATQNVIILANGATLGLLSPWLKPEERLAAWDTTPQMLYLSNPTGRKINHLLTHKHRKLAVKQLVDGSIMISGGWCV
jgi:glycine/D-amino acid oxidase-like deaminating enzyme